MSMTIEALAADRRGRPRFGPDRPRPKTQRLVWVCAGDLIGPTSAAPAFILAVVGVALIGGLGAAVLAAVGATVLLNYFFTFAATSVALLERDRDGWRQMAAAASNPIAAPEEAEVDVAVDADVHLVLSGRVPTAAKWRVLQGVAGQALLALRAQRPAAEAVEARRRAETTELRSALLSAVGHDLRTPLTAIKARPPESVGLVPLPRCRRPPARTTSVGRPGLHPGVGARHGGPRRGGVRGGCPGGGIPAVSRRWLRPSRTADRVESVWSGPQHHSLPVWSRVRALLDLVTGAVDEHSLMTSSTSPYPSVIAALCPHGHGGTAVRVVVETLQAAEGGFSGGEPASACVSVPGLALVPLAHEPAGVGVVHVHRHSGQHVRPGRPRVGLVIAQAGS
jgi:hypothetical protein